MTTRFRALSRTLIGVIALCLLGSVGVVSVSWLNACPLCEAMGGTISDDIQPPAVGVLAKCIGCKSIPDEGRYELTIESGSVRLLGQATATPRLGTLYSIDPIPVGKDVWVVGIPNRCDRDPVLVANEKDSAVVAPSEEEIEWVWSAPLVVSEAGKRYLLQLPEPGTGDVTRLEFFYENLFSSDLFVSDDAYNECARMPLEAIRSPEFRDQWNRDRLIEGLRDKNMLPRYKSFLWMVLAVCGNRSDLPLFEELALPIIEREIKQRRSELPSTEIVQNYPWLAASMAAYIHLGKERSLEKIEALLLENLDCPIVLKSIAISAIRVLGNDLQTLETKRLGYSLALVLNDPDCADLVIPDLSRWDYWEATPKLVSIFHAPESNDGFIRTPIINFMRRNPLPEAKNHLELMKQTDAKAFRRAMVMIPVMEKASTDGSNSKTSPTKPTKDDSAPAAPEPKPPTRE